MALPLMPKKPPGPAETTSTPRTLLPPALDDLAHVALLPSAGFPPAPALPWAEPPQAPVSTGLPTRSAAALPRPIPAECSHPPAPPPPGRWPNHLVSPQVLATSKLSPTTLPGTSALPPVTISPIKQAGVAHPARSV